MDKIEHSFLNVNGLSLHVAHTGNGEKGAVLFLHGFPEIWYSWRHQMLAFAAAGFKCIAPDSRGYGLSDQPPEPESTAWDDLVADLAAILDLLSIPKVFVIGKDFGVMPAYGLALRHPHRVLAVVTLGVPFIAGALQTETLPEGFYVHRWREPDRAEADFGRFDVRRVIRTIYILFSRSEIPIAEPGQEIMDLADSSTPLPPWFTEEDLNAYAALYQKSQFRFPLHIPYRSLHKSAAGENPLIEVPALLIMGEKDYVLKFPGMEEYIRGGMVKQFVPKLEVVYVPEGCHFVQEQFPDRINDLILDFLGKSGQA
ncbi:AB hydrolase superfamily protein YfhM-like [Zingiber officinale]|uniref:AB hydrolase-1 domain-containing protein n=1 Tax=Zingiber officinale TaxID=94328 RepID=A0A8J5K9E5_ZINOF|nr:AB hydrolase superfamily protein YfhM-like [Zingiber officinale]KAG6479200.1 hypothetical protein ZIOFF_062661 [Zingiber officinale]